MALHVGQLSSRADMAWCFHAVTVNPAAIMGLEGHGLDIGRAANMALLRARDPIEAIRLRPPRLAVIRAGRVIARSPRQVCTFCAPERPGRIEPADYAPAGGSEARTGIQAGPAAGGGG